MRNKDLTYLKDCPIAVLGVKFSVPTPIIDAMIVIGGAFHEKSFFEETRYNLDYLGIGHMTKRQLLDYLYEGRYL
jgi:opine dehydrogenase